MGDRKPDSTEYCSSDDVTDSPPGDVMSSPTPIPPVKKMIKLCRFHCFEHKLLLKVLPENKCFSVP